jgi:FkbM family methyltransferase
MTIASKIAKILPKKTQNFIKPKYDFLRAKYFLKQRGGSYKYNKTYGGWLLNIPMPNNLDMLILARTYREFNRAVRFGTNKKDLLWKWINWIDNKSVVYDIGSANGLEGLSLAHLKSAHVHFIEPYTPSIETILKTIYLTKLIKNKAIKSEVIHAACTNKEDYKRLSMHAQPTPGETRNTYGDRKDYEEGGGRDRKKVIISQWIKGISIDSLNYNYKLKSPEYVKIDVDGHETLVINGALKTIKSKTVKSWAIEITGEERIKSITNIMKKNGYVVADDFDHYPGYKIRTIDRFFMKKEYLESWKNFKSPK